MRKEDIINKAKEFCIENNVNDYPVRIIDLCKAYGISVFEKYLPENVSGYIVIQSKEFRDYNTNKVIVVNLSDSASRRRFTIAHELAHFLLHKKEDETLFAHRDAGQNGGIEHEANIFASNILMPEELVRKALNDIDADNWGELFNSTKIDYIARCFAVSSSAAEVRLKQLKLI